MSKKTDVQTGEPTGDVVLQEMWHIKDTPSASYGHDVDRLCCRKPPAPAAFRPSSRRSVNQTP